MKRQRGFTLIEIVLVVAIISVILIVGMPQVLKNIKAAQKKADLQKAKYLAYAMVMFSEEKSKNIDQILLPNVFYKIDQEVLPTLAGDMNISDYISGDYLHPAVNKDWYFYYYYDVGLKVYCGDDSTKLEVFPEPNPYFLK